MKFIDLTGQKFNYLTVIKELGNNRIICRCDCGTVKEYDKYKVKTGKTKSCGCKRYEFINDGQYKIDNKEGEKFNHLTVVKEVGENKILCHCDCGNEKILRKDRVINGSIKDCGCIPKENPNFIDLTGKVFGNLTVIKKIQNKPVKWLCKCSCGNTTIVLTTNLTHHKSTSCNLCANKSRTDKMHHNLKKFSIRCTNIKLISNRKLAKNNKSGINGVFFRPKLNKWEAKLGISNTLISLGKFDTKEEAIKARKEAEKKYFLPIIRNYFANKKTQVRKSYIGQKFGLLTVLEELGDNKILCHCDCGNIKTLNKSSVVSGHTKSCGCLKLSSIKKISISHKQEKIISYIGKKFNHLTIIEELGARNVLARCDCGNVIKAMKYNIIYGQKKCCSDKNCPYKTKRPYKKVNSNIIGEKFNALTVLEEFSIRDSKGRSIKKLRCQCDCGNVIEVAKSNVTRGHTKSCGCLKSSSVKDSRTKDYTGKKFGLLTIIKELGGNKVLCHCDCGNEKIITKSNIVKGTVKSCGCLKLENLKKARAMRTIKKTTK